MRIVVLDGFTLNPGDLSWAGLQALGSSTVHDRTTQAEVVSRAAGAEVVLTNKTVLTEEHLAQLPALRFIGVMATGTNVVDLAATRARGIVVSNVPAYSTRSTAQMTLALLLELCHQAGHHARTVREGRWCRSADFCYWDHPLVELDGRTMGIVGFGAIGRAVAGLAQAFGMRVLVHTRRPERTERTSGTEVSHVTIETLFREADVVSLHCPLTSETRHLVNATTLAWMKPGAFLLNTARGPLVDEAALAEALQAGRIAGAAVDVLSVEPPAPDNPLLTAPNCLVTPHLAWATKASRARLLGVVVENVRAFLAGRAQNVVS